ncbi:EAL domain-containing protein [Baaleninema sp.]|uniref:EAL domain-containing protein n=1 Tax=Baaleninema sp. TaxID=3101197 RepID=UPI003CFEBC90
MNLAQTLSGCSIAVFIFLLGGGYPSQARETRTTVQVGIYQNEPKVFLDEEGEPAGFWVDLLEEIAAEEDWSLQYVPCEWEQCLEAVEENRLDLMMDVAYSGVRNGRFAFNREAVLSGWSVVYRGAGVSIDSILDLDGKRVAVLEDSIQYDVLLAQTHNLGIAPEWVVVRDFREMFRRLARGEVDAAVANRFFGRDRLESDNIVKTNILVNPSRLHFIAPRVSGEPLLAAIDGHLEDLIADGNSAYYQAMERWLEPKRKLGWGDFRRLGREVVMYVAPLGLVVFGIWNYTLKREVKRRRQVEDRLQTLADNIPGTIYQYVLHADGSDGLLYVSSGCRQLWEVEAEAAIADTNRFWDLVHPEDIDAMRESVLASARSMTPWEYEWRIITPSGQCKWLQGAAKPQQYRNGDVVWDGLILDISARKEAEEAWRRSEQRFHNMAANVPGAIFRYVLHGDGSDGVEYMSPGCFRLWEVEAEAVVENAQILWDMVHLDDRAAMYESVLTSARTLEPWFWQWRITTPSGKVKWLEASGKPERQDNGDVVWDTLITDVSDRKRSEAVLQQQFQREQALNRVVQAIRNSLDLDTIFATATAEMAGLLAGLDCFVARYFPEAGVWRHVAEFRRDGDLPSTLGFEVSDADNPFTDRLKQLEIVQVRDSDLIEDEVNREIARRMPGAWLLVPLAVEGRVWGCVVLTAAERPFAWTEEKVELTRSIADQLEVAIQQVQLYQQVEREKQKLLESQTALVQAQQLARMGNWELEVATQRLVWSENLFRMFGFEPGDAQLDLAKVLSEYIHAVDREKLARVLEDAMTEGKPYDIDLRFFRVDGSMGYMEARAEAIRDANGQIVKVFGTSIDISDRKQTEIALRESETRYRTVVEYQTDFILRSRPDTTITFANEVLCRALGMKLEEIVGKTWHDFANADDLEQRVFQGLDKLSPTHSRFIVENRDTRADGSVGWTQWLNEGIFDDSGQLVEIQSVGRDITELKQVDLALRESEERLRLVTENMSDLVCLHHRDGRYLYVTPSSEALLGYRPEELIGRDPYELFHPDDRDRVREDSHEAVLKGQSRAITYRIRQKSGKYIWLETLTQGILGEAGEILHLQTTSRDVSDRVKVEKQLKHDALHDGLTGLPNRNCLMERLDLALKRSKRYSQFQFAVLFLDLDNFKVVNDSLGHFIGDELLLKVAELLQEFVRETDLAARLGGDEFVILLEEIEDLEAAVRVAERVLEALRSPFQVSGREAFTSASIGIVMGTPHHNRPEDLLRDADLAMYRAKHAGRGRYAIFDPAMHFQVVQRLHLENDLRRALDNDEFVLYYQPIVYLETQVLRGFEALIRWQHPERGVVSPGDFIPVAEETGLIEPMGRWILQAACQQLAVWQGQFRDRSIKVSVNLSARQLHEGLLRQLEDLLKDCCLYSEGLVLEITESMLVQNVEATCDLLERVRSKGIRLSIDDFGTGYSSLSYLHRLPVDALKIDRAFVSLSESDSRNQAIAESIVALSNLLELNAIAEGIETPQQLEWLRGLGCELGQGYLFSAPVPADMATEMLKHPALSCPRREF